MDRWVCVIDRGILEVATFQHIFVKMVHVQPKKRQWCQLSLHIYCFSIDVNMTVVFFLIFHPKLPSRSTTKLDTIQH